MIDWLFRGPTSLLALFTITLWHITAASSAAQCPERHGEAKPAPGSNVIVPINNAAIAPAAPLEKDASNDGPAVAVEIRIIGISEETAKRLGVRYGINCFKCKKPYFGGKKSCMGAMDEKFKFDPKVRAGLLLFVEGFVFLFILFV